MSPAESQSRFQNVPQLTNGQWTALGSWQELAGTGRTCGLRRGPTLYDSKLGRQSRVRPQAARVAGSLGGASAGAHRILGEPHLTSPRLTDPPCLPMLRACGTRT